MFPLGTRSTNVTDFAASDRVCGCHRHGRRDFSSVPPIRSASAYIADREHPGVRLELATRPRLESGLTARKGNVNSCSFGLAVFRPSGVCRALGDGVLGGVWSGISAWGADYRLLDSIRTPNRLMPNDQAEPPATN